MKNAFRHKFLLLVACVAVVASLAVACGKTDSSLFIETPTPPTRAEAPYPLGTIPNHAVRAWRLGIGYTDPEPYRGGYAPTQISSYLYGYVKNQLVISVDDELENPVATISDMLRDAGLNFDRIEVFTAEDYADYDSISFINFLSPTQDYRYWQTLRDNFGFVLADLSDWEYERYIEPMRDRQPAEPADEHIRYQVKIHTDEDLVPRQLRELGVGTPLYFTYTSPVLAITAHRTTLYFFAGGIWTTFGDDLVWFNNPLPLRDDEARCLIGDTEFTGRPPLECD